MSRTMGASAISALNAQQTDAVFLFLLDVTLTIDGSEQTLHFVNNTTPITRLGTLYTPLAFKIKLPNEGESIHEASLVLDAVDLVIIEAMRNTTARPQVSFILILASAPDDTPEAGPFNFELSEVSYNAKTLNATLTYGNHLEARFPSIAKTPYYFPGMF